MAQATISIAAPCAVVYGILAAVELYSEWAPFTTAMALEGPLRVGVSITERVELTPGASPRMQLVVVTKVCPPLAAGDSGELVWESRMAGSAAVLYAVRTQTVTPDVGGGCTYRSVEAMSGAMQPLVVCLYGGTVRRGFEAFALALKARAERAASAALG
jgi:hypothetical protein